MNRIRYNSLALAVVAICTMVVMGAGVAHATPTPNSAVLHLRVFNDCPISTITTNNFFPGLIEIDDEDRAPLPACVGFANLHTWRFSTDGTNAIQFLNGDGFQYAATVQLNGAGEGGLSLAPWWSPDADGLFNVRTTDGEIACFGGRMPFFSFTAAFGITYVNNQPIRLGITYVPNGLSSVSPAQIIYDVDWLGTHYTSGPLNFDQGNPAEDPPHGQWGALNPWYAGGHDKMFVNTSDPNGHGMDAKWLDIQFSTPPVAAVPTTWGKLKGEYR